MRGEHPPSRLLPSRDGSEPVREFVAGLDAKRRAALLRQLDRLNHLSDATPHLPFPHSSQVEGELRELRCHMGSDHYRMLYRRSGPLLVLLHDEEEIEASRRSRCGPSQGVT